MQPRSAAAARSKRADAFVESIGVNTHLGYTDTVYNRHDLIERELVRLGVRHIRDGAVRGQTGAHQAILDLAAHGIKLNMIVGDPLQRWGSGSIADQLDLASGELRPAVDSLEGPNEYNGNARDLDPHWVSTIRRYQTQLYRQVKGDPRLRGLPVLGPSLVGAEAYAAVGNMTGSLNYGNVHVYPSGAPPELEAAYRMSPAERVSGRKRIQVTETGYHNAVGVPSSFGHHPASEHAAAVYMPRLYMEYFREGVARTFSYELIDQWPDPGHDNSEARFGLLRNDFSEKPAYRALRRLISLLRDPGPSFAPRRLRYRVAGAPSDLHQVLLQKRDGSFYLALWRPVSVWDQLQDAPLRAGTTRVRLVLGRTARVEVHRPSVSGRPLLRRSRVRSLSLKLPASLTIVKIAPGCRGGICRLRPDERRAVRALKRPHLASTATRWLQRRAARIRHSARRRGWRPHHRRTRYRYIRRVLRRYRHR